MRKVILDSLPKKGSQIDWVNSIGCKVDFVYNSINGFFEIKKYNKSILTLSYNEETFEINRSNFIACKIGNILKEVTSDFKYNIGDVFSNGDRKITITDKKYILSLAGQNCKYYKFSCSICGWTEGWILESGLTKSTYPCGCSCCKGKTVVEGINDIPTTAPWMIPYFQGGYDEAKLYTKSCSHELFFKCTNCNKIKDKKMTINSLHGNKSLRCTCGDGISYPEKIMFKALLQLGLEPICQYTGFENKKYRYDFKIAEPNVIIETHGNQHYIQSKGSFNKPISETQRNDKIKKEIALLNGIKEENYIVINCSKSTLEFIKENILSSRLAELYDLSKIDWEECEKYAMNSKVKEVCNLWEEYRSTLEISKVTSINRGVIISYLNRGFKSGLCDYDAKKESIDNGMRNGKNNGKKVEIFKDNVSLGIFNSCTELANDSEKLIGVKLNNTKISAVCTGVRKHHRNHTFRYVI